MSLLRRSSVSSGDNQVNILKSTIELIGNGIFTLAFLLSGSPLAPLLAHVAMHIAAVVHAYGTSIPLPPHY